MIRLPNWTLRLAQMADAAALEELIVLSVRQLQAPFYSAAQREAALGPIFGVDCQLIKDGTYFVAEIEGRIAGCGGWSKRKALFGGDHERAGFDLLIDPVSEPARIRAFFTHPDHARQGIGKSILAACEAAIVASGFSNAELVATLPGESLYRRCGYSVIERFEIPMSERLTLPVMRMTKQMGRL